MAFLSHRGLLFGDEYSLYHNDDNGYTGYKKRRKWSTDAADTGWVSFDRPYSQFCQDHLVRNPKSIGSGEFLLWEFPLSYWIEQERYDVSYISNVDTHTYGPGLKRTKGFISVGHDEAERSMGRRARLRIRLRT